MTANLDIINAQLLDNQGFQKIKIRQGIIQEILPMENLSRSISPDVPMLDVAGDWITLGGVDLQINGALGLAFPDVKTQDVATLHKISQFLWEQGVDAYLPTIVTTSVEKIRTSLAVFADFIQVQSEDSAQILGIHLEGPFLNEEKRGAHPAEHLLPLTLDCVKKVLEGYANIIKIITLAPELDPTGEVISYLHSLGIIVSLGHSQATAAVANQAFNCGASMVTHAFNAMPSLHHREPGLLGAAITYPGIRCGFIADGQHISPIMVDVLLRASYYEKGLFLVSDALAPLGLPDGIYPWDTRQIQVKNGTARLLDGTLSGTTLPLLAGVQNLVKWGICDVKSAIALATESPRHALGLPGLAINQPATLLRWHLEASTNELTWQRILTR